MPLGEHVSQIWARVKLAWYVGLAVAIALAAVAWRRYRDRRRAAAIVAAATVRATQATGEAIEQAESERLRHLRDAETHAQRASAARARADQIAGNLQRGGHVTLANLIRAWNTSS